MLLQLAVVTYNTKIANICLRMHPFGRCFCSKSQIDSYRLTERFTRQSLLQHGLHGRYVE